MFIDINKIEEGEGLVIDEVLEIPGLVSAGNETIPVRSATLRGRAERGSRGVDLKGRLDATLGLVCSRCDEPFDAPLAVDVLLTLVPEASEFGARDAKVDAEDALLFYAADGKAELSQIAAEQVYLNLPLKPVCHAGCKGLCPKCGANRNWSECECGGKETDARLAPLLQFRKRR